MEAGAKQKLKEYLDLSLGLSLEEGDFPVGIIIIQDTQREGVLKTLKGLKLHIIKFEENGYEDVPLGEMIELVRRNKPFVLDVREIRPKLIRHLGKLVSGHLDFDLGFKAEPIVIDKVGDKTRAFIVVDEKLEKNTVWGEIPSTFCNLTY